MANYKNQYFRYKLDDNEIKMIDEVWEFIDLFMKKFIFISDYRNHVIKKVRKRYTPEKFYQLETIANKLFWNIRWILYPFWKNSNITPKEYHKMATNNFNNKKSIPNYLSLCNYVTYDNDVDLRRKIESLKIMYAGSYYRSFINKIFVVDKKHKIIYIKPMEGSSIIFSKNYFNLLTSHLMMDRKLYEKIINDPFKIHTTNVPISEYYQQFDYGFPNLNTCVYSSGDKETWMNKIMKMYYFKGNPRDKYWSKIIF